MTRLTRPAFLGGDNLSSLRPIGRKRQDLDYLIRFLLFHTQFSRGGTSREAVNMLGYFHTVTALSPEVHIPKPA